MCSDFSHFNSNKAHGTRFWMCTHCWLLFYHTHDLMFTAQKQCMKKWGANKSAHFSISCQIEILTCTVVRFFECIFFAIMNKTRETLVSTRSHSMQFWINRCPTDYYNKCNCSTKKIMILTAPHDRLKYEKYIIIYNNA